MDECDKPGGRRNGGDVRLELCLLVSEFVVDRTFDLPCLLQKLERE